MTLHKALCLWLILCALPLALSGEPLAPRPALAGGKEAENGVVSKFFSSGAAQNANSSDAPPRSLRKEINEKGFATVYIQFTNNSSTILPASRAELEAIRMVLEEEPSLCLRIAGHTDAVGDPAYNLDLSRRRAESVKESLTKMGVEDDRLGAVGFGDAQPIADNGTEEGKARNRRVELLKSACM